jgi:hypothetical protein
MPAQAVPPLGGIISPKTRSPKRGHAWGLRQHQGHTVRGWGYCLKPTRTSAARCWYLKPKFRLTVRAFISAAIDLIPAFVAG